MTIKELFEAIEDAEKKSDDLLEESMADPDNTDLDEPLDEAYNAYWDARRAFTAALIEESNGQLDAKSVNWMLACKRSELKAIMAKAA